MEICRRVMDSILRQIIDNRLTKKFDEQHIQQILTIQQCKMFDENGKLKTTFPSRSDLNWKNLSDRSICIERIYTQN